MKKVFYWSRFVCVIVFWIVFSDQDVNAQYAFEKYPSPQYEECKSDAECENTSTEGRYDCTWDIDRFFENKDRLTIRLTWYDDKDYGTISVFRASQLIQTIKESHPFSPLTLSGTKVFVSDIDGNGNKDIKLVQQGTGNGIMGMLVKVSYLFQKTEGMFEKVSFEDMAFDTYRMERDVDEDGNHEIITMHLTSYNMHNYWVFNLYEYSNGDLQNVNYKVGYPLVVKHTYVRQYSVTDEINKEQAKQFEKEYPDEYEKN